MHAAAVIGVAVLVGVVLGRHGTDAPARPQRHRVRSLHASHEWSPPRVRPTLRTPRADSQASIDAVGTAPEAVPSEAKIATVDLLVIDGKGYPLAGVDVALGATDADESRELRETDENGRVQFTAPTGRSLLATVEVSGDEIARRSVIAGDSATVVVRKPIVRCTLHGDDGESLRIGSWSRFSETPSGDGTGSISIGAGGGASHGISAYQFAWPEDVATLELSLSSSGPQSKTGTLVMTEPLVPCRVDVDSE